MRPWLSACLVLITGTAWAQNNPLLGAWCAPSGEVMYVEEDGIGFNEHTFCTAEHSPEGEVYTAELECRNVYFADGEWVEAFQETVAIRAEKVTEQTLLVALHGENEPTAFERCD